MRPQDHLRVEEVKNAEQTEEELEALGQEFGFEARATAWCNRTVATFENDGSFHTFTFAPVGVPEQ